MGKKLHEVRRVGEIASDLISQHVPSRVAHAVPATAVLSLVQRRPSAQRHRLSHAGECPLRRDGRHSPGADPDPRHRLSRASRAFQGAGAAAPAGPDRSLDQSARARSRRRSQSQVPTPRRAQRPAERRNGGGAGDRYPPHRGTHGRGHRHRRSAHHSRGTVIS